MLKADLHIHSEYSPPAYNICYASVSKIDDVLRTAKKNGLKAIAITDHNIIKGSLKAEKLAKKFGLISVPAIEVSSKQGHVLAYDVKEDIKLGMDFLDTIDKIHDLGGLAVCAHPLLGLYSVGKKCIKYFDGVEILSGRHGKFIKNDHKKQFITAGSDAHTLNEIGNVVLNFKENFGTKQELIELLLKQKTQAELVKKTRKIIDITLPQFKNFYRHTRDKIKHI